MDKLAELTHGAKVVLGSAILLLIFSFFDWFNVDSPLGDIGGVSMWNGIGVVAALLVIATIAWQVARIAKIKVEIGISQSMITGALAVFTLIFVFIRFIDKPGGGLVADAYDRTIWAWIGLALAIIMVAGAWLNMQAAGESMSDVKAKLGSMGGGGGAATPPAQAPPPPPPSSGDDESTTP